jgi:hypothetical protein
MRLPRYLRCGASAVSYDPVEPVGQRRRRRLLLRRQALVAAARAVIERLDCRTMLSLNTAPALLVASPDNDDQIGEAVAIAVGSTKSGTIDNPFDVDMFRLDVKAGQRLQIDLDRAGGGALDSVLRLFDPDGYEIAFSDDTPAPAEPPDTLESYISYAFSDDGTFYLGVSGAPNQTYDAAYGYGDVKGSTGGYTLRVNEAVIPPDGNDQISEASSLAVGATTSNSIGNETDVDMFKFTVKAGQTIDFDLDLPTTSGLNSLLRLFDASGSELWGNDDGPAPGEPYTAESFIRYAFTDAGTYYVGVSNSGNWDYDAVSGEDSGAGSTGAYTLSLRVPPASPADGNDQISEASSLTLGAARSGTITPPTDVDMYSVQVTAGQELAFDVDTSSGSALLPVLRLFDGAGTELQFNGGSLAPGETSGTGAYIDFHFAQAGTYYIAVSSYPNTIYDPVKGTGDSVGPEGGYTLTASVVPADADDSIPEATAAAVGDDKSAGIASPTDVHVYKVDVKAGQKIGFDVDVTGGLDSYLELFDGDGYEIYASDNDPAPNEPASKESYIEARFDSDATVYVAVSGAGNSQYNPADGTYDLPGSTASYTLRIVDIPAPPDNDDQIAEAQSLALGATANGTVDPDRDVDMYKFNASAGQELRIAVSGFPHLRVFDATGSEIAAASYADLLVSVASTGTYYVGVSGSGNEQYDAVTGAGDSFGSTGPYSITISAVPPDTDDQISEAKPLTPGSNATGTIDSPTDVDMYSFTAAAGSTVRVDFDDYRIDAYVRLFDSAGTELGAADSPYLVAQLEDGGTYYVAMSGYGNGSYDPVTGTGDGIGSAGDYYLNVSIGSPDSDDQITEAAAVTLGTTVNGTIDAGGDVDLRKFAVSKAGQQFLINVGEVSLDAWVRIFDDAGTELASADDSLVFTAPAAGTYYAGISDYYNPSYDPVSGGGDDPYSDGGNYTLNVSTAPTDGDDQIAEATAIAIGASKSANIANALDVDMYKVTAAAKQEFNFVITRDTAGTSLRLFDATGAVISTGNPSLRFVAPSAGTYYLGVSSSGNVRYDPVTGTGDAFGSTGAYTLAVLAADGNDQLSEATAASIGSTQSGSIGNAIDVDVYKFTVKAGQRLGFDLDRTGTSFFNSYLRLFDAAGNELTANDDAAAPGEADSFDSYIEYAFATGGTYYVAVSGSGNISYNAKTGGNDAVGSTGAFTLRSFIVT